MNTYCFAGVIWSLSTFLAVGCSPSTTERTELQGNLTYQGNPIERGQIELYPIDGTEGPMVGSLIEQGEYRIEALNGPMVGGSYQVRITGLQKTGEKVVDRDRPQAAPADVYDNFIPAAYNSESKLKVMISSKSPNQVDFDLPLD